MRDFRVLYESLVGRIVQDQRSVSQGIVHPFLQLGTGYHGAGRIVRIAKIDNIKLFIGDFSRKTVVFSTGDELDPPAVNVALPDGLDTVCSEKGSGLSEGQAQRIAIARALLHSGGVLILDEATSALDRETEDELLRRLSQKVSGGKTILWITHRESVTSIADAVLKI